jgi:hypothetical protein
MRARLRPRATRHKAARSGLYFGPRPVAVNAAPEKRGDCGLVGGDRLEIAHRLKLSMRWAAMCGADVALYAGDVDRRTKEAAGDAVQRLRRQLQARIRHCVFPCRMIAWITPRFSEEDPARGCNARRA